MIEDLESWQILLIAGAVLVIIEMLTPTMFFLNFALASFLTAAFAFYYADWNILIPVWIGFSALFLVFLRPLLNKKNDKKSYDTGIGQYIGRRAKVSETVTKDGGTISIFDERWNARSENGKDIPVGSAVVITKNEGLIMYVRKEN